MLFFFLPTFSPLSSTFTNSDILSLMVYLTQQGVSVCVSATTVTVIAFDRYISIIYREHRAPPPPAVRCRQRLASSASVSLPIYQFNYCQVVIETIIIWVVGILFGLPVAFFQKLIIIAEFYQISHDYVQCQEKWPTEEYPYLKKVYSVSVLVVQCVLPSLALIVTGSMITGHLNKLGSLLLASSATQTSTGRTSLAPPSSPQIGSNNNTTDGNVLRSRIAADQHKRNVERNQSVTRTLLAVSVSFTVCWLPLYILNALIDLNVVEDHVDVKTIYLLSAACHAIAMTSAPLNALLYGWYNPSINRELITWRFLGRRDSQHNGVLGMRSRGNQRNPLDSRLDDSVLEATNNTRNTIETTNTQSTPVARSTRVHSKDFSSDLHSSVNFI